MIDYFPLLFLIPACSILNHLGGQSTKIPYPRIVCRVFGMPIVIYLISIFAHVPIENPNIYLAVLTAGFALWAIPHWGQMFMAIHGEDRREYDHYGWIGRIADFFCEIKPKQIITYTQAREWGTVWGTIRGGFMYPLFITLSFILTDWALPLGVFCFSQGFIYCGSKDVLHAEYKFGALIGLVFTIILILSF